MPDRSFVSAAQVLLIVIQQRLIRALERLTPTFPVDGRPLVVRGTFKLRKTAFPPDS